jgi:hypothetical protein
MRLFIISDNACSDNMQVWMSKESRDEEVALIKRERPNAVLTLGEVDTDSTPFVNWQKPVFPK